jgi:hypothetical protein
MVVFVLVLASILFVSSFASAGMFDWFGKMTGKVTSNPVNVNITVADIVAPVISSISTISSITLSEGPVSTSVVINFSASDSSSLNDSSAVINLTKAGETARINNSCVKTSSAGITNAANYSCTVVLYWFDGSGSWNITAGVKDISNNLGMNATTLITVNALTGFVISPSAITWASIIPGSTNQTATNDPITMNNTGNQNITAGNVQFNTTNLKGEVDNTRALYANNFSVGNVTGGGNPECGATTMSPSVYTAVDSIVLPRGNFTINDGNTGQQRIYFCLKYAGTELTSQAYSTANQGAWTLKIA